MVKNQIVVGTCDGSPCADDLSSLGLECFDLDGKLDDIVVDGILFPKTHDSSEFNFETKEWEYNITAEKEKAILMLSQKEKNKILEYFPDTDKCQQVRDLAVLFLAEIEACNSEPDLTAITFEWTIT